MVTFMASYHIKWKKRNWYVIISFTLIVGLRGVGIDYHGYKGQYELLVNIPYGLFDPRYFHAYINDYTTTQFEPFYLLVIKILKYFNAENYWFFMIIAFGQIFFFDNFVRHFKSGEKMMMSFVFFGCLLFIETFNGMRQFLAFFAYLNIVHYIAERKWKHYFGYGVLLYCLHSSAIFLLPLYFVINIDLLKNKALQFCIYIIVVGSTTYFINQLTDLLNNLYFLTGDIESLKTQYLDADNLSLEGNRSVMTHVYRFITFAFMVMNSDKFKEVYGKNGVIFYNMTFIGYLLAELSFNMGIYRINYYFFYNVFIVMGLMLYQTFSGYNRGKMQWTIVAFGIMILYMAWFGNAVFKEANECSPYKLSPELGEVVSPNDDFEYKTRVFHFTDFGVTC
jgi:hypothetical protein